MAAAISAGAVLVVPTGTVGDTAADDVVVARAEQCCLDVAPCEDELVSCGQHIVPTDDVREVDANLLVVTEVQRSVGGVGDIEGGGVDDAHRGVVQEDTDDLESAVATAQEQARGLVVCVAGELEPWRVAPAGAEAEGIRHLHVAAGGVAVWQPNPRRRHTRRQLRRICGPEYTHTRG